MTKTYVLITRESLNNLKQQFLGTQTGLNILCARKGVSDDDKVEGLIFITLDSTLKNALQKLDCYLITIDNFTHELTKESYGRGQELTKYTNIEFKVNFNF